MSKKIQVKTDRFDDFNYQEEKVCAVSFYNHLPLLIFLKRNLKCNYKTDNPLNTFKAHNFAVHLYFILYKF